MLLRFPARAALACLALAGSVPCAYAETASWYGPGFHGRRAADGSLFDQDALTAAHKTLPFGTRVRVTCTATGRSVVVRITDRGPFIAGRAIDLSRGAARAIGLSGVGRVHLAILG
ncbi:MULTISPECIES: septal ring lytic transglycosylase RlpA family protein [unclassified Methylobacterium]|uniref:septal ring lytic transglycosylase RlpA family protein n=1 Tax=unclassified Methylobacterium TaxID=2615210 RepID=UPI0005BBEBB3|nr:MULTISPECIES: septal ring lytic transglycosylase RlpA family protein [unclassified Methylobacterium]SFV09113.1 rare lipoprotein A [Methylobacterium sp. UNCCL125]